MWVENKSEIEILHEVWCKSRRLTPLSAQFCYIGFSQSSRWRCQAIVECQKNADINVSWREFLIKQSTYPWYSFHS